MSEILTASAKPLSFTDGTNTLTGDIDTDREMSIEIQVSEHPQSGRAPATSGRVVGMWKGSVNFTVSDAAENAVGRPSTRIMRECDKFIRGRERFRLVTDDYEVKDILFTGVSIKEDAATASAQVSIQWTEIEVVESQVIGRPGARMERGRRAKVEKPLTMIDYVVTNNTLAGFIVTAS